MFQQLSQGLFWATMLCPYGDMHLGAAPFGNLHQDTVTTASEFVPSGAAAEHFLLHIRKGLIMKCNRQILDLN